MKKKKRFPLFSKIMAAFIGVFVYGMFSTTIVGVILIAKQSMAAMDSIMTQRTVSIAHHIESQLDSYESVAGLIQADAPQAAELMAADSAIKSITPYSGSGSSVSMSGGEISISAGAVTVTTDAGWLDEMASAEHIGENSVMFVTDKQGTVLMSNTDVQIAVEDGDRATINGKKYVVGSAVIENTDGWQVFVCSPMKGFVDGIRKNIVIDCFIIIISAVAGFIFVRRVARMITKPIFAISSKVTDIAEGRLSTPKVDVNTNDELQDLSEAVNGMSDYITHIISDIHVTAEEVAKQNLCVTPAADYIGEYEPIGNALGGIINSMSAVVKQLSESGKDVAESSEEMSQNSSALSEAAAEQAASIESLNTAVVDISQKITANADNAQNASRLANESSRLVNESNSRMDNMLKAMAEINATSSEIENIIKTIQDISFQTNILSLNAAIEAARAGEAGQGFAVVAGEVGALASKTAESAKSTTELIHTALKAVENGTVMANDTAEILGQIVEK
ncbi:MAG: methyl-accepting chemotaxis protein, partial [Oscillospiraceae bacterium]